MKNRIAQLINSEGLSASKFADIIGVQRSSISHILSGRNNPSLDFIQKIMISLPKVNLEWLLSGEGEMYKRKGSPSLFTELEGEKEVKEPNYYHSSKLHNEHDLDNNLDQNPVTKMDSLTPDKKIEKLLVFYTDKTFREYSPS